MCIYYHGGKKRAADWIVSMFPKAFYFLDICGGAGTVTAAACASGKYEVVVYNDINNLLHDFLVTVVNRPRALTEFIRAWPLGRHALLEIGELVTSDSQLRRAAGVFLSTNFNGHGVPGPSVPHFLRSTFTPGRGEKKGVRTRNKLLREIAGAAKKLQNVNFENLDGMTFYKRYHAGIVPENRPSAAVIFLDPPYGDTKNYRESHLGANFGLAECLEIFADRDAYVGVCYVAGTKELEELAERVIPFHSHFAST